jgi:hypothetical protein
MKRTRILLALAAVAVVAGAYLSIGSPRVTLLNTGVRIDYPAVQGAGRLLAAVGLALGAFVARPRWTKGLLAVASLVAAASGMDRLLYRVDAGGDALSLRSLLGTTDLPWSRVSRVDDGPSIVVVWGEGDNQIRLETGTFTAEQRAILDRTIARRVNEAAQRKEQQPSPGPTP